MNIILLETVNKLISMNIHLKLFDLNLKELL